MNTIRNLFFFILIVLPLSAFNESLILQLVNQIEKKSGADKTLLVLDFTDIKEEIVPLSKSVSDSLVSSLLKQGCVIANRDAFDTLMAEKELEMSGLVDSTTDSKLTKVNYIVSGYILELEDTSTITVKMTDADTGSLIISEVLKEKNDNIAIEIPENASTPKHDEVFYSEQKRYMALREKEPEAIEAVRFVRVTLPMIQEKNKDAFYMLLASHPKGIEEIKKSAPSKLSIINNRFKFMKEKAPEKFERLKQSHKLMDIAAKTDERLAKYLTEKYKEAAVNLRIPEKPQANQTREHEDVTFCKMMLPNMADENPSVFVVSVGTFPFVYAIIEKQNPALAESLKQFSEELKGRPMYRQIEIIHGRMTNGLKEDPSLEKLFRVLANDIAKGHYNVSLEEAREERKGNRDVPLQGRRR